jgi:hypothetical protein
LFLQTRRSTFLEISMSALYATPTTISIRRYCFSINHDDNNNLGVHV